MSFPLKDVRFTIRRGDGDEPTLHPRLLRDRSILPKLDIAIQYFETMLGSERRELDPEALVHFFGDHKLARCMVASLAVSYRYRPRDLEQIVTRTALRRLQRSRIDSPMRLRLALFDRVNEAGRGFLGRSDRLAIVDRLEADLKLRRGELDRLFYLDAEEHAILIRLGEPPAPADVVAQYNLGILQTLLGQAARVELLLADSSAAARRTVALLCAANDVDLEVGSGGSLLKIALAGRQDALGSWTRYGRKLSRTVMQILERVRATTLDGTATLQIRNRQARLRLTGEVMDVLGGAPARSIGWHETTWSEHDEPTTVAADRGDWNASPPATVVDSIARLSRDARGGWRVRRAPDPRAWAVGVVVPDLLLHRGSTRALVCLVRSPAHAERLATIARVARNGEPLVFIGPPDVTASLRAVGARTITFTHPDPAAILAQLAAVLARPTAAA